MKKTPAYIAAHIRTVLKNGGSAPHTEEVQRFFKHEVQSRGWYTAELRKVAKRFRRDEFKLFERWLDRVSTWADHDALVHCLIGPMIAADDRCLTHPLRWAK